MKYSQIFSKTSKNNKVYDSINATLLTKAGFISQTMSGVYTFLPLGLRVLNKIENIVREEMDKIAVEVLMPALSPKEMWENTGRLEAIDILFGVSGGNDKSKSLNPSEYILNPTHEEIVTPLSMSFRRSYKDFPFALYQIQSKFRNEARPKSGLLRAREFRMKDLYSFHTSSEDLDRYYEQVKMAYKRIFDKLGIGEDTIIAAASGGTFTSDFSHEFQTICDTGEDTIFIVKSNGLAFNREVAPSKSVLHIQDQEMKELEYKEEKGIIGVDDLCKVFNLKENQTVKTLIFETDTKEIVIAALRGDYDINEEKLMKIVGAEKIRLASEDIVKEVTGAEVGYAGILNVPEDVIVIIDESIENLINFECGANETNFHVINVNWGRDIQKPDRFYDIKMAKEGDIYEPTGEVYEIVKASEIANIFPLGTKYSESLDYTFIDKNGEEGLVYMGCYGLGTSRAMGIIAEKCNDEKGLIWPSSIAPFKVHVISLVNKDQFNTKNLVKQMENASIEVLWDDREDVSPGEKFSDADLIGCPYRIVVSKKSLAEKAVEIKGRSSDDVNIILIDKIVSYIQSLK